MRPIIMWSIVLTLFSGVIYAGSQRKKHGAHMFIRNIAKKSLYVRLLHNSTCVYTKQLSRNQELCIQPSWFDHHRMRECYVEVLTPQMPQTPLYTFTIPKEESSGGYDKVYNIVHGILYFTSYHYGTGQERLSPAAIPEEKEHLQHFLLGQTSYMQKRSEEREYLN